MGHISKRGLGSGLAITHPLLDPFPCGNTRPTSCPTYSYDQTGRRIGTGGSFARTGVPDVINTANYDAANQQLTLGTTSATYDNNGNLTTLTDTSGTTTYTWNARDQLVSLSGPGVTASFTYDALGRRKSKTVNGTTPSFLYDGLNVVQELSGTTPTANLLTCLGIDETLLRTDSAGARSFLTDGLGSTLALTNSAGLVQSEYTYEPFGKTTASGAASTNAFKYTGREDDGTGLYYYRARYYHPTLQRLISEDPVEFAGGDTNLYAYVTNDPVNFVDPEGLGPITLPGGGMSPGQAGMVEGAISGFGPMGMAKGIGGLAAAAAKLGFAKKLKHGTAPFNSHGQCVFQKGNRYITPDADGHIGGVWKMFDGKGRRLGTYDGDLNRIGD